MQTIQDAKILVVDDNRELRSLIKEELTGAGYRAVRMADSAAAARQAISGELPELVILDINLPDGDGARHSAKAAGQPGAYRDL